MTGDSAVVWLILETSYAERDSDYSLWGLLVNARYLTVTERIDANSAVVIIPNDEVMSEFRNLVSEYGCQRKRLPYALFRNVHDTSGNV